MNKKDYEWFKNVLPIFGESFQDEIIFLKEYLITNNVGLLKKQTTFFKKYDELLKNSPNSRKDILDETYEEYRLNFEQFPKVINNSIFVSTFSFMEAKLIHIINLLDDFLELKIKLFDLAGNNTIDKCHKYFSKVANINLELLKNEFDKIKDFQKIRNLIVHNDSNVKKRRDKKIEEQSMYNYIIGEPRIKLDTFSGYFIINDYKYIDEFLDIVSRLLSGIIKSSIDSLNNKKVTV